MANNNPSTGAAGNQAYDDSDTIDVFGFLGVFRRRKWLIAGVVLAGTAAAVFLSKQLVPTYTARAAIVIERDQISSIPVPTIPGITADNATIATQVRLLQSRTYLSRVMEDLNLFEDPEFNPSISSQEREHLPLNVWQPLEKVLSYLPDEWLIATGIASEPVAVLESEAPALARENAINNFIGRSTFYNDGKSFIISIGFTSPSPEKAALIANRIAEVYVNDQLKNKLLATDKTSVWLEDRLENLRVEVIQAEEAIANFVASNDLVRNQGSTLNEQDISNLNRELINTRAELAERQAKLSLVRNMRENGQSVDTLGDVTTSALILRLREQEVQILREEAELANQFGPRHPRMIDLQNEKANLEAKINAEVNRILVTLENDVRIVASRVNTIESQLNERKDANKVDQAAEVRLRELERQLEAARTLYEDFLARSKETQDQQEIVQPDIRIVSIATPPSSPSSPGTKLFAAAGFTGSLMIGTLLALLFERFDRGLRSSREVESYLGVPTLGMVPKLDKLKRGQKPYQYLMEKPLSGYAESIRSVYTAVKLSNVDHPPKVVMVTSSLPQEGKTTLAVSLATFAARSHKRVLLIDLDLRHPSVHRELGWSVSSGLVEYMSNDRTLEEVIHHDLETGLHFLPIKTQTTNPTDLLDSQKMRRLIDICRENYDYVVLDSAPLVSVTDSKFAALLADKIIFGVRWGETIATAAQDAMRSIKSLNVNIAGAVLTQVDMRKHAQYGYGDIGQYYDKSQSYYVN